MFPDVRKDPTLRFAVSVPATTVSWAECSYCCVSSAWIRPWCSFFVRWFLVAPIIDLLRVKRGSDHHAGEPFGDATPV